MTEKNSQTPVAEAAAAAVNQAKATSSNVTALAPKPAPSPAPAVNGWTTPAPSPVPVEVGVANTATHVMPVYGRSADLAKRTANAELKAPETVDSALVRILQARRGHDSLGEFAFHAWLLSELHLRMRGKKGAEILEAKDSKGEIAAFCVRLKGGKLGKIESTTMFSCHIDTVDRAAKAFQLEKQPVCYDPVRGHIFLDMSGPYQQRGDCLGADDGAGVWLMLQMIQRGKPGTYMFHRGEERGCIGSNKILHAFPEFLGKHEVAVAFDRPDDYEIITHQGSQRCASDKCATALMVALNAHPGMAYKLSDKGLFTDTKVYRGVIAECFNLGVGYYNQHTPSEHLNYGHLVRMLDAIMATDFDALPVDRDPLAKDPVYASHRTPTSGYGMANGYGGSYGGRYGGWDRNAHGREELDRDVDIEMASTPNASPLTKEQRAAAKKSSAKKGVRVGMDDVFAELDGLSIDEIETVAKESPEAAAILIAELFSELNAARARLDTYRNLIGLNDV